MGANGTSHSPRPREDEMRYLNSGGRQRKMILHSGGVGGNFMFLISISEYSWYSMHGSPMLSMPGPVSFSLTHKFIFWRLRDTCYNTLGFLDVQFSSVQSLSHVWLSMTTGLQHARPPRPSPIPGVTQIHVHWVGDAIQPSHPLSSLSPAAFNLFQWVCSLPQVAKVLEFQLQHQSFQWMFRTDLL